MELKIIYGLIIIGVDVKGAPPPLISSGLYSFSNLCKIIQMNVSIVGLTIE